MSSDNTQTPAPTCAPGTLEEELEKIEREQSEVVDLETKERELEELHVRARELASELRAARTSRRRRSAEGALPVIHPREPCVSAWDDMSGDERVRACGKCKSRVYDLGGLDPSDARRLLSEREGRLPSHVVGRVDGTVTVESCEQKRRRLSPLAIGLAAFGALGLLTSGMALGYMLSGEPAEVEATHAVDAIEMNELVEELAEARERATAAEAKAATPPPPPVTPDPPKRQLEEDDRSERRERKRRKCRRRHLHYESWAIPLFFFMDDDASIPSDDCDPTY